MNWKKLGKSLLFPRFLVKIILFFATAILLVYSLIFVGAKSVIAYVSYALALYTLTVWCIKIPFYIKVLKIFRTKNEFARRWREDPRLRVNVSLYSSFIWNNLYGGLQVFLGFYYNSFWFLSLGAYYICLGVMRFALLVHTRKYKAGENLKSELTKYRACGWVFLLLNLALSLIVFFMVHWNRTFEHHAITVIAMALYTFIAFTVAIVNVVKYRKYNSPVFSASKAISLAAALVSMLTLESTMLTTFSDGTMSVFEQKLMLGLTGGVVSAIVVIMAIFMIVVGTQKIKRLNTEVKNGKQ